MKTTRADEIDLDLSGSSSMAAASLFGHSGVQLDVDINKTGKQHGHLKICAMDPARAPHQVRVPVCVIRGRQSGPVITIMAGIHGDEHEGTLTIQKLARSITEDQVKGCLILLPSVNTTGMMKSTRINPADGQNIDYAFPGRANGSPSERLALEITRHFIAPCELLIDLRSGGPHLRFSPSAAIRFSDNKEQRTKNENAMFAFGAPNSLRLPASSSHSCLQGMVHDMDKQYVLVELGGGSGYDLRILKLAHTGCLNILRHMHMLDDELDLASTRLLEVRDDSYYIYAPCTGLYEPLTYLGESVWHNEPMANIVSLTNTADASIEVFPAQDATLIACHPGGHVSEGDLVAILAEEVQG